MSNWQLIDYFINMYFPLQYVWKLKNYAKRHVLDLLARNLTMEISIFYVYLHKNVIKE